MALLSQKAAQNLEQIRKLRPLIHTITNPVVMNFTANALLAMGARPVMAYSPEEVEDMVMHTAALVLNLGTLTAESRAAMLKAGDRARSLGIPVVLDPVGSGATSFRTRTAEDILKTIGIRVVRANPSEILSLRSGSEKPKGVYASHAVEDSIEFGKSLARERFMTVAATGPVDAVTDGLRVVRVKNGHPLMERVTGIGCTASAVIAAFLCVDEDPLGATATALAYFGFAGQKAGEKASAPGSFAVAIIDALYSIRSEELEQGCRLTEDRIHP